MRLISLEADTLTLGGVDLVSGTPIVDIKPYIPAYDAPAPGADCTTATWIDPPPLPVRFTVEALAALDGLQRSRSASPSAEAGGGARSPHASRAKSTAPLLDLDAFQRALEQALAADPRPLYRWRRERAARRGDAPRGADGTAEEDSGPAANAEYVLTIDGVVVRCQFERRERPEGSGLGGVGTTDDTISGFEDVVSVLSLADCGHDEGGGGSASS